MKKSRNRVSYYHLLNMLGTNEVNSEDVIEFILRTIYNRPKKENRITSNTELPTLNFEVKKAFSGQLSAKTAQFASNKS